MKLVKVIGTGALALCAGDWARAAYPPLDRPTPPPGCADGIGYPNAQEWGWYRTRWRRWPTDFEQPDVAPPAPSKKLAPDIQPFETPLPEHEDRRAPPPTQPKAEEEAEGADAGPKVPPATTPTTPIVPSPDGTYQTPPTTPRTPPQGRMPWETDSGETTPPTPAPDGGLQRPPTTPLTPPPGRIPMPWEQPEEQPTGDLDPPPRLPSMATVGAQRAPAPPAPTSSSQPRLPFAPRQVAPTDDPPPKLPIVLASTR
jgi:hypothetical protein